MSSSWKRAQIIKHALEELKPAGFGRIDGARLHRDTKWPISIEFYKHPSSEPGMAVFDGRAVIGISGDMAPEEYDGYWNFTHLATTCNRPALYELPDGQPWEETTLAQDLRGPLVALYKYLDSYETSYDFMLSDGREFAGHNITIKRGGIFDKRSAIVAAYGMAKAQNDTSRIQNALDALKAYADLGPEERKHVQMMYDYEWDIPNVFQGQN